MKDIMVTKVTVTRQINFTSSVNNIFLSWEEYPWRLQLFHVLHGKGKKTQKHQNKSIHLLNWKLSESSVFPHTKLYTWSTNASLVKSSEHMPLQEKNLGYLSVWKLPKLVL